MSTALITMLTTTLTELITVERSAEPLFLSMHRYTCEMPVSSSEGETVRR